MWDWIPRDEADMMSSVFAIEDWRARDRETSPSPPPGRPARQPRDRKREASTPEDPFGDGKKRSGFV